MSMPERERVGENDEKRVDEALPNDGATAPSGQAEKARPKNTDSLDSNNQTAWIATARQLGQIKTSCQRADKRPERNQAVGLSKRDASSPGGGCRQFTRPRLC